MVSSRKVILSFESSCDETAIAAVDQSGRVVFQHLASQIDIHRKYGGVIPEVASRAHFDVLAELLDKSVKDLEKFNLDLEAVAATKGPGLIGPLIVGSACAEGFARGKNIKFIGVHHLRGHLASVLLDSLEADTLLERSHKIFPSWVVLVSGGHTQVLYVNRFLKAELLAETADDAAGECFDKSAKLMGLPYPGGPQIEALAERLESKDIQRAKEISSRLPRPQSAEGFSFSGLKTAIRLQLEKNPSYKNDPAFAWAIQDAIADSLIRGMERAQKKMGSEYSSKQWIFCGGVSANKYIRDCLEKWGAKKKIKWLFPPLAYCTDNAAMIAVAAWVQSPDLALTECLGRVPL
jgi:N6-L-threonylcarbamoyladenine synthase